MSPPHADLDTSVLVSMFWADVHAPRAQAFLAGNGLPLLVSDFAMAELASVVAQLVRTRAATREEASRLLAAADDLLGRRSRRVLVSSDDIAQATTWLRGLDLTLRALDAIHIAAALRLGATLVTFDAPLAAAARALDTAVAAA